MNTIQKYSVMMLMISKANPALSLSTAASFLFIAVSPLACLSLCFRAMGSLSLSAPLCIVCVYSCVERLEPSHITAIFIVGLSVLERLLIKERSLPDHFGVVTVLSCICIAIGSALLFQLCKQGAVSNTLTWEFGIVRTVGLYNKTVRAYDSD